MKVCSLQRTIISSATFFCLLSNVVSSDQNAVASPLFPIDLSYTSHLPEAVLVETIHKSIENKSPRSTFEIDISASSLRDNGLVQLLEHTSSAPCFIRLVAQRNQLTPQGVSKLIEQVMETSRTRPTMAGKDANDNDEASGSKDKRPLHSQIRLESLDLSWNRLGREITGSKAFCRALEKMTSMPLCCPRTIRLDRSGIGASVCRAIAKGLMQSLDSGKVSGSVEDDADDSKASDAMATKDIPTRTTDYQQEPLSLSLSGNSNVGNAGLAALAAAVRTIITKQSASSGMQPAFGQLDLSSCGIGDIGINALVMALEKATDICIEDLILSGNAMTDSGASALARAITQTSAPCIGKLNLSGNSIGDRGMADLAESIASGKLKQLDIRSCQVQADGAAALGTAIALANNHVEIDLSGNPIGILRGKSKTGGGKYSASRLKSKASATAASYVSQGMGFLKKGLKEVGMDSVLGVVQVDSGESDDEEEAAMGADVGGLAKTTGRCGIKALANAFIDEAQSRKRGNLHIRLGLRQCFLDHGAADALAAMLVTATTHGIELEFDLRLNPILEDDMVAALEGKEAYRDQLSEMAERHMDALEAVRGAREKAKVAGRSARDRSDTLDATWDLLDNMDDEGDDEEVWDSDADYDDDA